MNLDTDNGCMLEAGLGDVEKVSLQDVPLAVGIDACWCQSRVRILAAAAFAPSGTLFSIWFTAQLILPLEQGKITRTQPLYKPPRQPRGTTTWA